ncbi:MAG: hypothetical protein HWE14_05520 [Flavobacteriia bacterium]|nr:hypothetical protein [Flavobacteriia bacterium]
MSAKRSRHIILNLLVLGMVMLGTVTSFGQTWTGNVSNEWTNAGNWSGGVPGANSTPNIPGNRPNQPVITTAVTVKDIQIGDWNNPVTLTVDGGSLTVSEDVNIVNYGELKMLSGSILLDRAKNNAAFSFAYTDAKLTLLGGTFTSDLSIQVNGTLTTGNADIVMNNDLNIASGKTATSGSGGTWTMNADFIVNGIVDLDSNDLNVIGTLTIGSGGVMNAGTGDMNISGTFDVGSNGTYNGEDASTVIVNSISAKNSALITVEDGSIEFQGDVDLFQSATLRVDGTGEVLITGNGEFKQNGNLEIGSGSLSITGDVDFQQGGTLDVDSGSVNISGNATFSQSGTLNVGSGEINITGDANFDQSGTVNAEDATINISGNLTLGSNGSVFNAGTSTINLEGGTFTNNGTFNPDSSTVNFSGESSQTINGDVTFYNVNFETSGTLTTNGDVTVLNDAEIDTSAVLNVGSGNTLEVQGNLTDPNEQAVSTGPYVRTITAISPNKVEVDFSEDITSATASVLSNYSVNQGLTVTAVAQQTDASIIHVTLSGNMTVGTEYSFVFNNLAGVVNGQVVSANHTRRYTYEPATPNPGDGITNFKVVSAETTSLDLDWNLNGAAGVLIIARENAMPTFSPTNLLPLEVESTFGQSTELSDGSYAVYAGSGTQISIQGLKPNRNYYFKAFAYNGTGILSAVYNLTEVRTLKECTAFQLDLRNVLAGAYDEASGRMSSELAEQNLLPLSQPFSTAPFNYSGPESVASIPNDSIVDWILVELRATSVANQAFDSTIVARKACFLLESGRIVGIDGVSLPRFKLNTARPVIAIVYHRNHLPAMSSDTLQLNGSLVYELDFSTNFDAWYDSNAAQVSGDGKFMSGSRAVDQGYLPETDDYQKAWNNRNGNGYSEYDVDLDGEVTASDRARIFNSQANTVNIPGNQNP